MSPYPEQWVHDVVLTDGSTAHLRPIRHDDGDALRRFHASLSSESVYRRFFRSHARLGDEEVTRFTTVDYEHRMAFVAEIATDIVGIGRYERLANREEAEVAFVVADQYQGRGLGSLFLEALAAYAPRWGIHVFVAETLPDNRSMRAVFARAGFVQTSSYDSSTVHIRLTLESTPAYLAATDQRDWVAAVASVRRLLEPRTVVVVGDDGALTRLLLDNLAGDGFAGQRFSVGVPGQYAGVSPAESVATIAAMIDVAIICTPPDQVLAAVEQCGEASVGHVVILTGGFADQGFQHHAAQQAVTEAAHRHGMRVLGPNSLGVVVPRLALNASLSPVSPRPGNIGIASQSGGLGIALLTELDERGLGTSSYASMGNKADLSGNDFLRYWHADPATEVIALYLESFGNPSRFARVASEVSRSKPIVTLATPGSRSGAQWAYAHSGATPLGPAAMSALLRRSGVLAVDTTAELVDLTALLATQPLPQADRVAIIGNAGGPLVLAANSAEAAGLVVPALSDRLTKRLEGSTVPPGTAVRNPLNLTPVASAHSLITAVEELAGSGEVDSILVVWTPVMGHQSSAIIDAVSAVAVPPTIPVTLAIAGAQAIAAASGGRQVPIFRHSEDAVRALGHAVRLTRWRERDPGQVPVVADLDVPAVRTELRQLVPTLPYEGRLSADSATTLARAAGIATRARPPGGQSTPVVITVMRDSGQGSLLHLTVELATAQAVGLAPLTDVEANEMLQSLDAGVASESRLGASSQDRLAEVMHRVGQLAAASPELGELRLHLSVDASGELTVAGADLRLESPASHSLNELRRLR